MIYRVLEAGLSSEQNQEEVVRLDSYATQELRKHLQEHSTDQLLILARIEWGYLPVLDCYSSSVRPATLIRELQTSPLLFFELLKVVYRGANEEARAQPLLAADSRAVADEHQAQFPRLATFLRNLAEYYDRYAEREEEEAERRRLER